MNVIKESGIFERSVCLLVCTYALLFIESLDVIDKPLNDGVYPEGDVHKYHTAIILTHCFFVLAKFLLGYTQFQEHGIAPLKPRPTLSELLHGISTLFQVSTHTHVCKFISPSSSQFCRLGLQVSRRKVYPKPTA